MRFKQLSDVLDWAQALHHKLAELYRDRAGSHTQDRIGMLLTYLAEHENALALALEHFEEDADQRLVHTWYAQTPDIPLPDSFDELCETLNCETSAGLVALTLHFHDLLAKLYSALRDASPTPELVEVMDNLASMETREAMRTVRDAERLEDI